MSILRRLAPSHFIPVHPDNATKKDWEQVRRGLGGPLFQHFTMWDRENPLI